MATGCQALREAGARTRFAVRPGWEAGGGAGVQTNSGAWWSGFLADGVQGASLAAKTTSRWADNPSSVSLACTGAHREGASTLMSPAWLSLPCVSLFPLSQERWEEVQILLGAPAPSSQPHSISSLLSCCLFFFFFSPFLL